MGGKKPKWDPSHPIEKSGKGVKDPTSKRNRVRELQIPPQREIWSESDGSHHKKNYGGRDHCMRSTIVDYQTAPLDNNNHPTVLGPVGFAAGKKEEKEDWRRHWRSPQGNKGLAAASSFDLAGAASVPLSASASELESKRHPLAFVTLLPNTNSPRSKFKFSAHPDAIFCRV